MIHELQYVQSVYDEIAPHFSSTRYKPWPKIADFLRSLPAGSLICDIGCGNCKYFTSTQPHCLYFCNDICLPLLEIAVAKKYSTEHLQAAQCDCCSLPYRSSVFDIAISIALLHHIATEKRRVACIQEIIRIVAPPAPGRRSCFLIYAWALEQGIRPSWTVLHSDADSTDVLVPWHLRDEITGDTTRGRVKEFQRYCHLYRAGELERLVGMAAAAFGHESLLVELDEAGYDKENHYVRYSVSRCHCRP